MKKVEKIGKMQKRCKMMRKILKFAVQKGKNFTFLTRKRRVNENFSRSVSAFYNFFSRKFKKAGNKNGFFLSIGYREILF